MSLQPLQSPGRVVEYPALTRGREDSWPGFARSAAKEVSLATGSATPTTCRTGSGGRTFTACARSSTDGRSVSRYARAACVPARSSRPSTQHQLPTDTTSSPQRGSGAPARTRLGASSSRFPQGTRPPARRAGPTQAAQREVARRRGRRSRETAAARSSRVWRDVVRRSATQRGCERGTPRHRQHLRERRVGAPPRLGRRGRLSHFAAGGLNRGYPYRSAAGPALPNQKQSVIPGPWQGARAGRTGA